jgi:hypothetical protein
MSYENQEANFRLIKTLTYLITIIGFIANYIILKKTNFTLDSGDSDTSIIRIMIYSIFTILILLSSIVNKITKTYSGHTKVKFIVLSFGYFLLTWLQAVIMLQPLFLLRDDVVPMGMFAVLVASWFYHGRKRKDVIQAVAVL